MHKVLVALADTEADERLLAEVERHVTGIDAEVLVCRFTDEKEFETELRKAGRSGRKVERRSEIEASAAEEAAEIAERFFDDDVTFTSEGVVGNTADDILQVAVDNECDHIFITGRKRSPTGKVLFGDRAQQVLLNFHGPVTITTTSA